MKRINPKDTPSYIYVVDNGVPSRIGVLPIWKKTLEEYAPDDISRVAPQGFSMPLQVTVHNTIKETGFQADLKALITSKPRPSGSKRKRDPVSVEIGYHSAEGWHSLTGGYGINSLYSDLFTGEFLSFFINPLPGKANEAWRLLYKTSRHELAEVLPQQIVVCRKWEEDNPGQVVISSTPEYIERVVSWCEEMKKKEWDGVTPEDMQELVGYMQHEFSQAPEGTSSAKERK